MASTGIKTTNLQSATNADSVLVNDGSGTKQLSIARLSALLTGYTGPSKETLAQLAADLTWAEGKVGFVWGDPDGALRGTYLKSGAADAGSWSRIGDLPTSTAALQEIASLRDEFQGYFNDIDLAGSGFAGTQPGVSPGAFTSDLDADPKSCTLIDDVAGFTFPIGTFNGAALGRVATVTNTAAVIARRDTVQLRPGQIWKFSALVYRTDNPDDPNGGTVEFGVNPMRGDYTASSENPYIGESIVLRMAHGLHYVQFTFGYADALLNPDIEIASSVPLVRPFIRLYGADHTTSIVLLDARDITDVRQVAGADDVDLLATMASAANASAVASQLARDIAVPAADRALAARDASFTALTAASDVVNLAWSPRQALRDGDAGVTLLPLDPAAENVWTDTARTTLATSAGDRIASARLVTESGSLYAEQATLSNRPYLQRTPDGGLRQRFANSALSGAVVGSPGTLPGLVGVSGGTIAREIIATGTDTDGLPYVDIRLTGSPGSAGIVQFAGSNTDVAVDADDVMMWSLYSGVIAGSATNINSVTLQTVWRTSGGGYISQVTDGTDFKGSGVGIRSMTATAPATAAYALPQVRLNCSGAIDITLRFKGPQFEAGSSRTTFQKSTYTAGVPQFIDVTEVNAPSIWSLLSNSASMALIAALPNYGTAATVSRSTLAATSVDLDQSVSGAVNVIGGSGTSTTTFSVLARGASASEQALLGSWTARTSGRTPPVLFEDDPELPAALSSTAKVRVQQDGADYGMSPADFAGAFGAYVTPRMYGGDPTGVSASDAAIAAAYASGQPVMLDAMYRMTTAYTTPAYSRTAIAAPDGCGIIQDQTNGGLTIGDGSIVASMRTFSSAYASADIVDTTAYSDYARCLALGSGVRAGYLWVSDLSGGVDCEDAEDVDIAYIHARDIRSRLGQSAALHIKRFSDIRVGMVDALGCDRGIEPEYDAHRINVEQYRLEDIYPDGYSGQPAGYATYSFVLSAHSHSGEGACTDVRYGDGLLKNCLNPISFSASGSLNESDYPVGIRIGDVTIDSPRTRTPFDVAAIDFEVASLRFKGAPSGGITQLMQFGVGGSDNFARNIDVRRLIVEDGAFVGRVLRSDAPDCSIRDFDIGPQSGTSTTSMIYADSRSHRLHLERGRVRGAKYHSSVFHASGSPTGLRWMHTYTDLDGTNPASSVASAAWLATSGLYDVNNT
ncbi:hypothetical protein [Marivivens aquimaris]|uniref:hypothetical protein n=1 Tax=Marivivens aquimaris TaxID=2774876 RepID=UPI00187E6E8C|nr:hypothetical protein [Marivivens aquimaris]